jgi:hypothetical protein
VKRLVQRLLLGPLLISGHVATADESGVIIAERPGFSSSTATLDPSVVQVESGYQYTHDGGSIDFDDHTLPFLLMRFGLVENVELQFSWAGYSWTEASNINVNGTNDAGVGVKWQLNNSDATVPVALFAGLSLPIGTDEYSNDSVDPTVGAFWSYSAGMDWFGTVLLGESDGDLSIGNAVGINIPVNADTGAFVEYFGNYARGGGPAHYLNGGFAYLPRNDLQLDVNAGLGLNSRAADLFIGFGIAYRF